MPALLAPIFFCTMTVVLPAGCMGDRMPPARLTQAPCPLPGGRDYKAGTWFADEICWKFTPEGDVELAGGTVTLPVRGNDTWCTKIRCKPEAPKPFNTKPTKSEMQF